MVAPTSEDMEDFLRSLPPERLAKLEADMEAMVQRIMESGIDALPEDMRATAAEPGSAMNIMLSACASMVATGVIMSIGAVFQRMARKQ